MKKSEKQKSLDEIEARALRRKDRPMISLINEIRRRDKKAKNKLHGGPEMPKPGEDIYVPTAMYIDHGEDDVQGGLAEVVEIKNGMIRVEPFPSTYYSWSPGLCEAQEKLKKEFGQGRAHKDPDY